MTLAASWMRSVLIERPFSHGARAPERRFSLRPPILNERPAWFLSMRTLATFDGPARAIECARAIASMVADLGFEVRAGLQTREVELRGDDVTGMAVHIAARVANLAGAGQGFVSSTVKDLVTGSGIAFEDRDERQLKGVPEACRLFAVTD